MYPSQAVFSLGLFGVVCTTWFVWCTTWLVPGNPLGMIFIVQAIDPSHGVHLPRAIYTFASLGLQFLGEHCSQDKHLSLEVGPNTL